MRSQHAPRRRAGTAWWRLWLADLARLRAMTPSWRDDNIYFAPY